MVRGKRRSLTVAAATVLVGVCSVAGYAALADPSQCEIERDMLHEIRAEAEPIMEEVELTWIPTQGCGESTEPLAGVSADVVDWEQRRIGLDHMADAGWQRQPDTFHFMSPDGDVEATVMMAGTSNGQQLVVPMHVEIHFTLSDDG
jgi:hypothetical protein